MYEVEVETFSTFNQQSLKSNNDHIVKAVAESPLFHRAGLPLLLSGEITMGFGRGSRELGIPTANLPEDVVEAIPDGLVKGVYFGWATLDGKGPVHKMVVSIGWNPFYQNVKKAAETHIMHKFDGDLYERELRIVCLGWIRDEQSFASLDDLIEAIDDDIRLAEEALEMSCFSKDKWQSYLLD
eukprot:comp16939_c0_seq1/m.15525 comp16939_c0_seq1/g.15525  ORF comp16939_c0_seq1/g.15525 comp16939_c0_seq1/m.15525 type:complete len:183 (-) comp16939_c0_seq1:663-1211(-)